MAVTPLSLALRTSTKPLHTEAERTGVMAQLLRGRASRESYAALMGALFEIYSALEAGLERHSSHPVLAPLHTLDFARGAMIESDLRALATLGVTGRAVPNEALEYAAHLRALADEDPLRLIAHAWLRYLGDLNGGVIVGRIIRTSLALPPEATQFYEFPALPDPVAAAATWRAAVDAAPIDARAEERIIAEASDGFRRHIALFRALDPSAPSERDGQEAADSSSAA